MNLVDTQKPDPNKYARTADGKINFEAYKGLYASVTENGMVFDVRITDARQRFGHLDLLCVPVSGSGQRWVEHKNLVFRNDPATPVAGLRPEFTYEPSTYGANA